MLSLPQLPVIWHQLVTPGATTSLKGKQDGSVTGSWPEDWGCFCWLVSCDLPGIHVQKVMKISRIKLNRMDKDNLAVVKMWFPARLHTFYKMGAFESPATLSSLYSSRMRSKCCCLMDCADFQANFTCL